MTDPVNELPRSLASLISWLQECGYALVRDSAPAAFGDRYLRLAKDDQGVRVVRDRGQWFIDVSARAWGGGWFDVPLVMTAFEHRDAGREEDLDEQVAFLMENLEGQLSDARDKRIDLTTLMALKDARFHRQVLGPAAD